MPDIILDLEGIEGESNIEGFDNKIICTSFSFGGRQPVDFSRNASRTGGTVDVNPISLTRDFDKASTALMSALFTGKSWDTATIHFLKAVGTADVGNEEFLTITLTNAIIGDMSLGGSAGGIPMSESLTLSFSKIEFEYKVQTESGELESGAITAVWDVLKQKAE